MGRFHLQYLFRLPKMSELFFTFRSLRTLSYSHTLWKWHNTSNGLPLVFGRHRNVPKRIKLTIGRKRVDLQGIATTTQLAAH
ncbi:Uncharacterized protein APZ42_020591 [Daphnia magna]|uniref:Uncharacterized protein n=1 Tax=Daphnia magna TaxID=35525 RepID=A0A164X8W9_9CRUS|nr:Uncharacterized protein APZ42_020591 [Daphnia magna]